MEDLKKKYAEAMFLTCPTAKAVIEVDGKKEIDCKLGKYFYGIWEVTEDVKPIKVKEIRLEVSVQLGFNKEHQIETKTICIDEDGNEYVAEEAVAIGKTTKDCLENETVQDIYRDEFGKDLIVGE